jgi:hypothetical protein
VRPSRTGIEVFTFLLDTQALFPPFGLPLDTKNVFDPAERNQLAQLGRGCDAHVEPAALRCELQARDHVDCEKAIDG